MSLGSEFVNRLVRVDMLVQWQINAIQIACIRLGRWFGVVSAGEAARAFS